MADIWLILFTRNAEYRGDASFDNKEYYFIVKLYINNNFLNASEPEI